LSRSGARTARHEVRNGLRIMTDGFNDMPADDWLELSLSEEGGSRT
jgi:hypothetical protein